MSDNTNERGEPDEIWLQIHGDANPADYPDGPLPDLRGDDVTWCWEPIFEHDVKYVRADIVAALDKPAGPVGGEAVAWQYKMHECWHTTESDEPWRSKGLEVRPLYTHPAPPVVDDAEHDNTDWLGKFSNKLTKLTRFYPWWPGWVMTPDRNGEWVRWDDMTQAILDIADSRAAFAAALSTHPENKGQEK